MKQNNLKSWYKSGAPGVWMSGGAVAIAIIMTRKTITSDHPEEDADSPPIAAIETEMDPAVTAEELTEANS